MSVNLNRRGAGIRLWQAVLLPGKRGRGTVSGLILLHLFTIVYGAQGQSARPGQPIENAAVYSRSFTDAIAASINPATVPDSSGISAGIVARRGFMLAELGSYLLTGTYRSKRAWVGAQVQYAGSQQYNESMVGLSYGRDLGGLRLGIQFNYHRTSIPGYGSSGTPSADIAVTWLMNDKLQAGIHSINPLPGLFRSDKNEHYPAVFRIGAGYDLSQDCHLFLVAGKSTTANADVHVGLHYRIMQRLFLRFGIHTDAGGPEAAIGWQLKDFRLFITGKYHPALGFTPALQMNYQSLKSW